MSKTGYYIGGHSIGRANPKKVGYVSAKPFKTPPKDIISEIRKEKNKKARKKNAKKSMSRPHSDSTTIIAWREGSGLAVRRFKKKKK